jgi:hypothetical protein
MAQTKFQKFVHDIQPLCFIITSATKGNPPSPEELASSRNLNLLREFYYFCCSEFSIENLTAFLTIRDYKKEPTFDKAYFIQRSFLDGKDCKYELNTNKSNIDAVINRLEYYKGMHVYAKTPAPDIFDAVFSDAKLNVTDTLCRFKSAYLQRRLGSVWLYKVPLEKYIHEIPKHIDFIRSINDAGFKLPIALAV